MKRLFYIFVLIQVHLCFSQNKIDSTFNQFMKEGKKIRKNNPKKAVTYFNKALGKSKINKNKKQQVKSYNYLSYTNRYLANYPKALEYLFKSLKINEEQKDSTYIAINYFDFATVHRHLKEYKTSLNYLNKALNLYILTKDSLNQALTYESMGIVYRRMNKLHTAEKVYNKSSNLYSILKKNKGINRLKINRARLYIDLGKHKKSLELYYSLINFYKKKDDDRSLQTIYGNISLNYEKLKKYKLAIKYLDSAIIISTKNNYLDRSLINYQYRSRNYEAIKKYKKALKDYKNYKILYDSVFSDKKIKLINTLRLTHNYNKKRITDSLKIVHREQLLINENNFHKKQTLLYIFLFLCTAIVLIFIIILYINKKKLSAKNIEKQQLEFDLLQNKLENISNYAHFLQVDNKMRFQFKQDLLRKIKNIKNIEHKSTIKEYKSLVIDLQSQINTEKRLNASSESKNHTNTKLNTLLNNNFPKLSKSEREICNLIYLNLSNKEIMNIRNITLDSIKSARYRIRKKMNLSKNEELETYIKNLININ